MRYDLRYLECDKCGHACYVEEHTTPKGWTVTREDHRDLFCPECNPWLSRNSTPDPVKLQLALNAYSRKHG